MVNDCDGYNDEIIDDGGDKFIKILSSSSIGDDGKISLIIVENIVVVEVVVVAVFGGKQLNFDAAVDDNKHMVLTFIFHLMILVIIIDQ